MSELIFGHKEKFPNGDIIEIKVWNVPKTKLQTEGVSYSMVYIRNGIRIIGFDNFELHGHHKHVFGRIIPYAFVDIWKAIEDFNAEVDKVRRT